MFVDHLVPEGGRVHFMRHVWAQFGLAFTAGVLLSLWAGSDPHRVLFAHIGMALTIAAIITLFYQLHEMSVLFQSIARTTLIENDYLRLLNTAALRKVRTSAAAEILHRGVDNPRYERLALEGLVDNLLYKTLAPARGAPSGAYRENYREVVTLEFIEMAEAARLLGLDAHALGGGEYLLRETSIAEYVVVSPRLRDSLFRNHDVVLSVTLADVPGVPLAKRARVWVGESAATATPLHLVFKDRADGGFEYEGRTTVPFVDGQAHVWMKLEEWRFGMRQPHIFNIMALPTKGISATVFMTGRSLPLVFEGSIVAIESTPEPSWQPNGIHLEYPGWLLEGHGYFVWWWLGIGGERAAAIPAVAPDVAMLLQVAPAALGVAEKSKPLPPHVPKQDPNRTQK